MSEHDLLKQVFEAAARDPGPKQDWDAFIQTARRDRLVHRVAIAAAAATAVVLVALGGLIGDGLFDQSMPKPAERDEQREREPDEDVRKVERRIRQAEKVTDRARIAPGPGRPKDERPRRAPAGGDDPVSSSQPPVQRRAEPRSRPRPKPASGTCLGEPATIVGTGGRDVLSGTPGRDVVAALGGADVVRGTDGSDLVCGGDGVDHLYGGPGNDSLVGGPGDDHTGGGDGFDFVHFPTAARDVNVNLEHGFAAGDGTDEIAGIEAAEGTAYGDNFAGDRRDNLFVAGDGNDALNGFGGKDIFVPGPGDDGILGHGGSDTVTFDPSGPGVRVDLPNHLATGQGTDTIRAIENVTGTGADDVITGTGRSNALLGGGGDDTLGGMDGDDTLAGDAGDDTLDGGAGGDDLDGGAGTDTCTTGETRESCEQTGPRLGGALLVGLLTAWLSSRSGPSGPRSSRRRTRAAP